MVVMLNVNYPDPKGSGLVARWHYCPHYYYKPIDTRLVLQQLVVGEATEAKH